MKLALLLVLVPLISFAGRPSNEVPTSEILASFAVSQKPGEMNAGVAVEFIRINITDGRLLIEDIDLSENDAVTFSAGDKSIRYDAANPDNNILPYVGGVQYSMHFERYNGEVYKSMTNAPMISSFSSPQPDQVFEKTDTVDVAWNFDTTATGSIVFYETNCQNFDANKVEFNQAQTAAKIAAGAAENCDSGTRVQFYAVNYKEGAGYGTFYSLSYGMLGFNYGKPSAAVLKAPSKAELLKQVRLAIKNHQHVVRLTR